VSYRALQTCKANIVCERTLVPPWGLHGGKQAMHNHATIKRAADGKVENVHKATEIVINQGDVVTFRTAGGGGYGDPRERAPEAVARDVAAGIVSPEAAAKDYGATAAAVREPAE
jgi:N-methylhydantoinase B